MTANRASNLSLGAVDTVVSPAAPKPHFVQNSTQPKDPGCGTECKPKESFVDRTIEDPVAAYTLLLAVITALLCYATWRLYQTTVRLANDAQDGAKDQADKMERSIKEAAKAAVAMEGVAESMSINAQKIIESVDISAEISRSQREFGKAQLRAYITVLVGPCVYQAGEATFQGFATILNAGATPAKDVKWKIASGIHPIPMPADFRYTLAGLEFGGGTLLGAQKDGIIRATPERRIPEADVADIMGGKTHGLYIWGLVTYKDIFRRKHRVTFAQQVYWVAGNADESGARQQHLMVNYLSEHNCSS